MSFRSLQRQRSDAQRFHLEAPEGPFQPSVTPPGGRKPKDGLACLLHALCVWSRTLWRIGPFREAVAPLSAPSLHHHHNCPLPFHLSPDGASSRRLPLQGQSGPTSTPTAPARSLIPGFVLNPPNRGRTSLTASAGTGTFGTRSKVYVPLNLMPVNNSNVFSMVTMLNLHLGVK